MLHMITCLIMSHAVLTMVRKVDPFHLTRDGDKLYGRGTTDCLGHVAMITDLMMELATKRPTLSRTVLAIFMSVTQPAGRHMDTDISWWRQYIYFLVQNDFPPFGIGCLEVTTLSSLWHNKRYLVQKHAYRGRGITPYRNIWFSPYVRCLIRRGRIYKYIFALYSGCTQHAIWGATGPS